MPRYFFDVRDGAGFHRDEHGVDVADFEEAREECQGLLPEIVRAELPDGDLHIVMCDLRDEAGHVVYRGEITYRGTRVGDAMTPSPKPPQDAPSPSSKSSSTSPRRAESCGR